jgi:hypothetical protein
MSSFAKSTSLTTLFVLTAAAQTINLADQLAAGRLKMINRDVEKLTGTSDTIHFNEKAEPGIAWIQGSGFSEGTIEVEVRGRDLLQQSFVGVAFHGKDGQHYECVYLRPFNFRAEDPLRRGHALQYMAAPDYDWPRLRQEFPEKFERSVDQSLDPNGWVNLRTTVKGETVQVYVGHVTAPTLEVHKIGSLDRGMIGLWMGNNSGGDFRNLRITPAPITQAK